MATRTILLIGLISGAAAAAEGTGTLSGTIDKPGGATAVVALDRDAKKDYPGRIDAATGRFTIDGLPVTAKYDVRIDFGPARLEGVDLAVPATDEDGEAAGPLTAEDVETLKGIVRSLNKFEDVVEILDVRGNAAHAAVVMNKLRTTPFVNSLPGEAIWRAELWHFERPEETWVKVQDEVFIILYRERLPKSAYDAKSITFDPSLGGIGVDAKAPADVGRVRPPKPDPGVRVRSAGPG